MPPAIVFDLDGTLVDSLPGIATALNAALAEQELPQHPEGKVREFVGSGAFMLCRRAIPTGASDELARQVETGFKHHYAESWTSGTSLFPGIARLIDSLAAQGRRLAVLSNKPDAFTREIVDHLFPDEPFGLVRGQLDGSPRKPDPAAFQPIFDFWGIQPHDTLLVGDSTIDRQTAEAAKVPFLGVAWGYEPPGILGLEVASTVEDLRKRLR
ncbi:HAD family hydrolase [Haloferula sp. A504]|uniref:HAD family hydrolase n=1 Tax=Haloferula sp. A504 TaxID=3373601 RepID=UPI0031CC1121|nr:HAD-IA family hydrolase [Verrucomicrobiaceae bacterium E54]